MTPGSPSPSPEGEARGGSRIASRKKIEAAVSTAAREKACPVPTRAIRTPALAGPTTRIALQMPLSSATALGIAPAPISLGSSAFVAGAPTAHTQPLATAHATTIHSRTAPVRISTASTPCAAKIRNWLATTSR